jgi:hypothetical protein
VNETDRILFELRNEPAQAVELDGRGGLQGHLTLVQWMISKQARGECPHIHIEDWPAIRTSLGLPSWWVPGWPPRRRCTWAGDGS